MFLQTDYTGIRMPRNNPFKCGSESDCDSDSDSSDSDSDCDRGRHIRSAIVLVGDIRWSARTRDYDGWLLCDGRQIYRNAYPALFAIIGTSFGAGNGTTTFNIPDSRGRVVGAIGQGSNLTNRTLGTSLGEENHQLTVAEMPAHTHTGTTGSVGDHSHTYNDAYFAERREGSSTNNLFGTNANTDSDNSLVYRTASGGDSSYPSDINTSSNGGHSHTFTTGSTGGDNSHNNMQPTLFAGSMFICVEVSCSRRMR